jgi:4a-hydroxytetrahydrobiopterin dehydratase
MTALKEQKIVLAKKDSAPVSGEEKKSLLEQLPEWGVIEREGIPRLERTYKFKNFVEALEFTNRVGELAEEIDHHPAILLTWGRATVSWWTHIIEDLHLNDYIMAARTDELYEAWK